MDKICETCGNALRDSSKFCGKCGRKVENNEINTGEIGKENFGQDVNAINIKHKELVGNMKNYNVLSKNGKKNILFGGIGLVVVVIIIMLFIPKISKGTVSEAALKIAAEEYGYNLELSSYDIRDSFTVKSTIPLTGEKIKAKTHLVLVNAEAKDTNGELVEAVQYAVCVVDPEKVDGYVTYSPYSYATKCTDMGDKEIKDLFGSITAEMKRAN